MNFRKSKLRLRPRNISPEKWWMITSIIIVGGAISILLAQPLKPQRIQIDAPREVQFTPVGSNPQVIAKSDSSPRIAQKTTESDTDLTPKAREVFFTEIETVFGTLAVSGVPTKKLNKHLAQLNSRGAAGLRAVVTSLALPATEDSKVKRRIFLVDYLSYRMRWDDAAKKAAVQLVNSPIPANTPLRYRATTIAEHSELIEALIRIDWDMAVALIQKSQISQIRRLGIFAAYEHLLNTGLSKMDAVAKVRAVDPTFKI